MFSEFFMPLNFFGFSRAWLPLHQMGFNPPNQAVEHQRKSRQHQMPAITVLMSKLPSACRIR
jgi:hypothetical protein